MVCVLCGGVAAWHRYGLCIVCGCWLRLIGNVRVLFGGVATFHNYSECTVCWCGSVLHVWCVYFVVVW